MPAEVRDYLATDVGWPLRVDELVDGHRARRRRHQRRQLPGPCRESSSRSTRPAFTPATASPSSRRSTCRATVQELAAEAAGRIALALGVRGILNVQMIAAGDRVVVIEANPRASRTVPIVAKATGLDVVAAAVRCALGCVARRGRDCRPASRRTARGWRSRRRSGRSGACPGSAPSSGRRCGRPGEVLGLAPTAREATELALDAAAAHRG